MFQINFCCNQKEIEKGKQNNEYIVSDIEKDLFYEGLTTEENNKNKSCIRNQVFKYCIEDLREAEKEANNIVDRAKKNRVEFLKKADVAAKEIVEPYYNMAYDELKETEISINKELHVKTLEVLLSKDNLEDEEIEMRDKINETISTVFSRVCDVKLRFGNPEYVSKQLMKHNIKNKSKTNNIKTKLKTWSRKISGYKHEEKNSKDNNEKRIRFSANNDEKISTSTIELDEDYSKIDNMYGGSRIVSSFNTIHVN